MSPDLQQDFKAISATISCLPKMTRFSSLLLKVFSFFLHTMSHHPYPQALPVRLLGFPQLHCDESLCTKITYIFVLLLGTNG